jgi:hypothetical protein
LVLKSMKMKQECISELKMFDPRMSRIDNILSKMCPKFLDLYASTVYTVI